MASVPYASILVNEFVGNEDLDGNGRVYSYDFKVKDENNKPFVLDPIESNPKWQDPDVIVDWSEILNWYNNQSSVNDPLYYTSLLVEEFISNSDLDNNSHIYGHDFKVSDTEDKPSVLINIENHENWPYPSTEVLWSDLLAWYNDPESNPDPLA